MQSLDKSLAWNVRSYLSLSPYRRDIVRYLFFRERLRRQKTQPVLIARKTKIQKFVKCSLKTIQRFNIHAKLFLGFGIKEQFRDNGSRSSNKYIFDEYFLKALIWLDKRNLLRVNEERIEAIMKEVEIWEVRSSKKSMSIPPFYERCPYPSLTLSPTLQEYKEYAYIHPLLQKIGIPEKTKIMLSQYPEHAIAKGMEDVQWYIRKGNEVPNPCGLIHERIRNHAK